MKKRYETTYYFKNNTSSKINITPNRINELCGILGIKEGSAKVKKEGIANKFSTKELTITTTPTLIRIANSGGYNHSINQNTLDVFDKQNDVSIVVRSINFLYDEANFIEAFKPLLGAQLQDGDKFLCSNIKLLGRVNDDRVVEISFELAASDVKDNGITVAISFDLIDSTFNDEEEFGFIESYIESENIKNILNNFRG